MSNWNNLATNKSIQKTIKALKANGINAIVCESLKEARKETLKLIPQNKEVMTMSSVTLETMGVTSEINESQIYNSTKRKLSKMNKKTQALEMKRIGAAPEVGIGSVHAITQDGQVLIASNTGSQLPSYAYGSSRVIWIAGTQKIVKNLDEGIKRIYEYVLPLESIRVKKAYGMKKSNVSKLLIINKEINPGRIFLILVKEKIGF